MTGINLALRFRIFQRDDFTCQYCGAKAPHVPLEVDHIIPKVMGGGNGPENLTTACYACNHGKMATPLTPEQVARLSGRPLLAAPRTPAQIAAATARRIILREYVPVVSAAAGASPRYCAECQRTYHPDRELCPCRQRELREARWEESVCQWCHHEEATCGDYCKDCEAEIQQMYRYQGLLDDGDLELCEAVS